MSDYVSRLNDFTAVFNDTVNYPDLDHVSAATGFSRARINSLAAEIRAYNRAGREEFDEISTRSSEELSVQPPQGKGIQIDFAEPEKVETVEELIDRVAAYNEREAELEAMKKLVLVNLAESGWFGIAGLPDQHLNNPGTRLRQAFDDARLIAETEGVYAVSIGDSLDNFIIGRLEGERRKDVMSHGQAWEIQEHYFQILSDSLIIAIGGNHNEWIEKLGGLDILRRQFRGMGLEAIYDPYEQRVQIDTLGGRSFVHLARHHFPGQSMYHGTHGILKWGLNQWQGEDVLWGGHIHTSGFMSLEREWMGSSRVVRLIQLPSYKMLDRWAQKTKGFRSNVTFMAPIVLHNAETGETLFFEDLKRGIEMLKLLRGE